MPTAHFTPAGASLPQLPVLNPMAWGMMDMPDPCKERIQFSETNGEKITKETLNPSEECSQRLEERTKGKERDRSSELDCKPVRLSIEHEDSSEGSAVSSEVEVKTRDSGRKDRRRKRSNGIQTYSTANGKGSQGSSSMSHTLLSTSDCQSDTKMSKKHKKTSRTASQNTSKTSIIRENNVDVVTQDEEEDEQEESRSQGIPPSSVGSEKKDGIERLNKNNSTEEEHTDERDDYSPDLIVGEEEKSDREGGDKGEDKERTGEKEKAGLDDEAQVDNKEDPSDGEDTEGEQMKRQKKSSKKAESNSQDITKLDTEEEEGEETEGEEETENRSQDEEEARKTQERAFKCVRKYENESKEEEGDRKVNTSERNIHKSLEELHADDATEEEGVYNQEIEDENDDDGDEDEVVVKKAYFWSKDHLDDHQTQYHDDDDDDIEGLLNPQVNSQKQQVDEVEETDQPNGVHVT
ncbi:glutamic acid-rich protein isoform X2 [Myxocyprinus asiaticus]|uniref:glutamic acid-rich protein isoform X2 n=1 Tax=Myxocyprinus asiaticus TaxID=70543 RepID=UPI002222D9EB|nr:glutamic acid-rich protein isoform X2 [Myxocyprinus asiaticus]